ncbi:hypothetical protein J2Z48_001075 [Croceifilum oryzae]|uniref:Lipoprotein n=1 Tax=Croceifilum oryzae TaxID=1553429 RepID=A0AAJ1WS28_9BACL|nr:hypothetical protein [Croceifilum oryzae]MDQ0416903.1 hypothetical protein [Croceifilum oryzae]
MKKWILALSTLVFLLTATTGCSFIKDQVNATAIADDMNKIVEKANTNDELVQKINGQYEEFGKVLQGNKITPDVAKKAQPYLDNALKDAKSYDEAVKKLASDIPKLKELVAKFTDAETKKLADQFVTDFEKSSKLEVQYSETQLKLIEADKNFLNTNGKEVAGKDLVDKHADLNKQLQTSIDEFNKSWGEFNKKVTGDKIK